MSLNSDIAILFDQLFNNTLVSGLTLAEDATYTKVLPGAYDTTTGGFSASTTDPVTIKVIRRAYKSREIESSGGMIALSDIRVYLKPVAGLDFSNYRDDYIIYDGNKHQIKNVKRHDLGPTKLVIEMQLAVFE